ncbi:CoA ester lyase [Stappia sp. ES.058]|uniref:HpcH/HpaI aldolase/citrate lyase family protein n=1 Tax=Stappia sp. ES.058 TaxID=1881061 RepID=UPI00087A91EF|nr:CoA ester lyase [Stappia sp. ES.058]SDU21702.1 citrate lyase subunit beta / citryl-CoA lyase [Stappia sp. ES.058]
MRSLLFVPADSERKLAKGLDSGADVLLIDLEDSVALEAKEAARKIAAQFLSDARERKDRPRLYVRVNALDTGETDADLAAVMPLAPDGIMLPKSVAGRSVEQLDARLAVHEAQNDLADGATRILVVATETAASLFNLGSYAGASERLEGLAWGAEDLSADIGALANRDGSGGFTEPFRMARNLCLFGAVAAGAIPIDTVFTNFRDLDGLRSEAQTALRDGFTAKMAIHPAQVAVINEVFTPSDTAIADARRIIDAFAAAGDPGVVGLDGEMLDRPHLRRAEKLLARSRAAASRGADS